VRVPLLISYPRRIGRRRTIDMPVCSVDLAPTLLALSGLMGRGDFHGNDLAGWLVGGEGERSESVYCQGRLGAVEEWRMVVRGFDKIVVDRDLAISHLFNLRQDPYEMDNLAGEKGQRTKQDEMRAILESRMRGVSDKILPSGLKLRD
jgi:arylsulfatase A-like enzyme